MGRGWEKSGENVRRDGRGDCVKVREKDCHGHPAKFWALNFLT